VIYQTLLLKLFQLSIEVNQQPSFFLKDKQNHQSLNTP